MPDRSEPPILIAEDDADDAFLLERAIRRSSIPNPIALVSDGAAAIDYLAGTGEFVNRERHPLPVLALLDIKMPKRSGLEVLEWVRAQPGLGRLPVVMLTSSRQSADVRRAYDLGANSYLVKPGTPDGLLALVRDLGMYWLVHNETPELDA